MTKYKCCECFSEIEWDENCTIEESVGHYYCSNDDCITKQGGTIKVYYPTNEVWYE